MSDLLDYCPCVFDGSVDELYLLRQVKFTSRDKKNNFCVDFTVHCDPNFESCAYAKRSEEARVFSSRFSVIQYRSVSFSDISVGQVIGIVHTQSTVQFIVSRLVEEDAEKCFRKLPYPLFKYGLERDDNTRFTFEHVPIANLVGPCFYVPAIDHDNMSFTSIGRHHAKKENMSYFYVLTPSRTLLSDVFEYKDYFRFNRMKHPWDKSNGDAECFNFNYFLKDSEQEIVRDIINA